LKSYEFQIYEHIHSDTMKVKASSSLPLDTNVKKIIMVKK